MLSAIELARDWMVGVHPSLPWALLTLVIWLGAYTVRRYQPDIWRWMASVGPDGGHIADVWQALPSVLSGALVGAFATGGDYAGLWKGALSGTMAPLIHWALKKAPGPYRGSLGP